MSAFVVITENLGRVYGVHGPFTKEEAHAEKARLEGALPPGAGRGRAVRVYVYALEQGPVETLDYLQAGMGVAA